MYIYRLCMLIFICRGQFKLFKSRLLVSLNCNDKNSHMVSDERWSGTAWVSHEWRGVIEVEGDAVGGPASLSPPVIDCPSWEWSGSNDRAGCKHFPIRWPTPPSNCSTLHKYLPKIILKRRFLSYPIIHNYFLECIQWLYKLMLFQYHTQSRKINIYTYKMINKHEYQTILDLVIRYLQMN